MSHDDDGMMGRRSASDKEGAKKPGPFNLQRSEAVAEEPTMRAVAMMPSQPQLQDTFGLQRPSLGGMAPPPKEMLLKRPPMGLKKLSEPSKAFEMKEEWCGKLPASSVWVVTEDSLGKVPFPLERTHREIQDDPGKIASRISDTLRRLSIEADYDGEKAKAKCRTRDFVCFRIRMYAGGENGQPVVVECQRRSGPGRSFMQSCRLILSAAEGNDSAVELAFKEGNVKRKRCADMKCLQDVIKKESEQEQVDTLNFALNKALDLLHMEQHDCKVLGMEELAILTDPIKSSPESALRAARCILIEEGNKFSARDEFTAFLDRDVVATQAESSDKASELSIAEQLRHLALVAISNSLSTTARDGCLEGAVKNQKWFSDFMIPLLMEEIRNADAFPNNASVASCCLKSLVSCSDVARKAVRVYGSTESIISDAHELGLRRHSLLANETERCMKVLEIQPRVSA